MSTIKLKEIILKCESCDKTLSVSDVVEIAQGCLSLLYNQGSILQRVEKTIGEQDWNVLVTSVLGTFLSSIYATVEMGDDTERAIQFGKEVGAGIVAFKKGENDA